MGKLKGALRNTAMKTPETVAQESAAPKKDETAKPPMLVDPIAQAIQRARFSISDLTLAEVQLLGQGLGHMPMNQAYPLVQKITGQIAAQENAIVAAARARAQPADGKRKRRAAK